MNSSKMLTAPDVDFERKVRATVPGMAHFALTGPRGKCCGDCKHMVPRGNLGYGCMKYYALMGQWVRQELPRTTPSCKYFEERNPDGQRTADRRRTGSRR